MKEKVKYGARKFNQGSYNHSDKYAKDLFIKYITKKGHIIINKRRIMTTMLLLKKMV